MYEITLTEWEISIIDWLRGSWMTFFQFRKIKFIDQLTQDGILWSFAQRLGASWFMDLAQQNQNAWMKRSDKGPRVADEESCTRRSEYFSCITTKGSFEYASRCTLFFSLWSRDVGIKPWKDSFVVSVDQTLITTKKQWTAWVVVVFIF